MNNQSRKGKKLYYILYAAIFAVFIHSCDVFPQNDDFLNTLKDQVTEANATEIQVFIQSASGTGIVTPNGNQSLKVGIPFAVNFQASDNYSFTYWAAFNRSNLTEELSGIIDFNPHNFTATSAILRTATENILIRPVSEIRTYIRTAEPKGTSTQVSNNYPITVFFTKLIDPASFYYTSAELLELGILEADILERERDEDGNEIPNGNAVKVLINGEESFKNITIANAESGENYVEYYSNPKLSSDKTSSLAIAADLTGVSAFTEIQISFSNNIVDTSGILIRNNDVNSSWVYEIDGKVDKTPPSVNGEIVKRLQEHAESTNFDRDSDPFNVTLAAMQRVGNNVYIHVKGTDNIGIPRRSNIGEEHTHDNMGLPITNPPENQVYGFDPEEGEKYVIKSNRGDGVFKMTLTLVDVSQNVSDPVYYTIIKDTTPPVAPTIDSTNINRTVKDGGLDDWANAESSLEFTRTDSLVDVGFAGSDTVPRTRSENLMWSFSFGSDNNFNSFSSIDDAHVATAETLIGPDTTGYKIYIKLKDDIGNESASSHFYTLKKDTTPPTVETHTLSVVPVARPITRSVTPNFYAREGDQVVLTIGATDGGSGLNKYVGNIHIGSSLVTAFDQISNIVTYTVLANQTGFVTYSGTVTDKAGNTSLEFKDDGTTDGTDDSLVDTTPPAAPLLSTSIMLAANNGSGTIYPDTINTSVTNTTYFYNAAADGIKFTFTPPSGSDVKGYVATTGRIPTEAERAAATATVTLKADTNTTWHVYAIDTALNASVDALELTVAQDKSKPVVTNSTIDVTGKKPVGGTDYVIAQAITITMPTATDAGSGKDKYLITNNNTSIPSPTDSDWTDFGTEGAASKEHSLSDRDGDKDIYVWVKDKVNNISDFKAAAITLDTTAPTIISVGIGFERVHVSRSAFRITGDNFLNRGDEIILTVNATDVTSRIDRDTYVVAMEIGGTQVTGAWGTTTDTKHIYTYKVPEVMIGKVTYTVTVKDNLNHISKATAVDADGATIGVETNPPSAPSVKEVTNQIYYYPRGTVAAGVTAFFYRTSLSSFKFTFDASDVTVTSDDLESGIKGYVVKTDNGAPSQTEIKDAIASKVFPSADTYYISAVDNSLNVSTSPLEITIKADTTAPSKPQIIVNGRVEVTKEDKKTYFVKDREITLNMSNSSDTGGSGVASYRHYSADVTTSGPVAWDGQALSNSEKHTLSSGDGAKTIFFRVRDNVGNETTSSSIARVTLDTIAPASSDPFLRRDDGVYINGENEKVRLYSSTDTGSGVDKYILTNTNNLGGNPTWENYSNSSESVYVDHTYENGDGLKYVYLWLKDKVGNISSSFRSSNYVILDTTSPSAPYVPSAGETTGSLPAGVYYNSVNNTYYFSTTGYYTELIATDPNAGDYSGSGIKGFSFSSDGTDVVSESAGGIALHKMRYEDAVYAVDNVGNVSAPVGTVYDTAKPTIDSVSINNGDTYVKDDTVSVAISGIADTHSKVAAYYINNSSTPPSASNSAWVPSTASLVTVAAHPLKSSDTDGEKTVYVWAKDNVGNISEIKSDTITLDKNLPTITDATYVSSNSNKAYAKEGDKITLTVIAGDGTGSGIATSNAYTPKIIIGGIDSTGSGVWSGSKKNIYTYTVAAKETGVVAITVTAEDGAGNISKSKTANGTITVDTTAPTGTATVKSNNANTALAKEGDIITLTVTLTEDGSGLDTSVVPSLTGITGGTWTGSLDSNGKGIFTYAVATGQSGVVGYSMTARDNAGNERTIDTLTSSVTVDTTAPTGTATVTSSSGITYAKVGETITLTVDLTEDGSGLVTPSAKPTLTGITGDAAAWDGNWNNNGVSTFTYTVKDGQSGDVGYSMTASDNAGNERTINTLTSFVTVDTTAPTGTATVTVTPKDGTTTPPGFAKEGDTITLTVDLTENGSGLDTSVVPSLTGITGITGVAAAWDGSWNINEGIFTYTVEDGQSGVVGYSMTARDKAGNEGTIDTLTGSVTVDTTAPTITGGNVHNVDISSNTVAFTAVAGSYNVVIAPAETSATYAVTGSSTPSGAWVVNNTISYSFTEGSNSIWLWVKDAAGNVSTGFPVIVTVTAPAPAP